MLCHTLWGRNFLRGHGVYEVVRAAHANEVVEKVSEHIERLVQLLKGEEPAGPHALEEIDVIEPHSEDQNVHAKRVFEKQDEDEDEDEMIQEV